MGEMSHEQKKVGVIFGFIKQILALAQDFDVKNFVFCWDSRKSYRSLVYPEYKANRRVDKTEEQLKELEDAYRQFDDIRTLVLPMMGFKNIFHQGGYEADDLIAWVVQRFPESQMIVTGDDDLLQLLWYDKFNPILFYNYRGITDEAIFSSHWFGLPPRKWASVKAIAGCSGDNVKGIEGVGELTAARYVAGVLKDGAAKQKIESDDGRAIFKRNFGLVALPFSGLKPINIPELCEDELMLEKFKSLFGQYGFRSLLKDEYVEKWSKPFGFVATTGRRIFRG
jgi:DNA polymerase-1